MLHNAAILLIRDGVQVDLGLYNCWDALSRWFGL